MKAAHEFIGELAEHVSMPEVYIAIRELLLNADTNIDDFVEIVERDSMLAVRVMRMAKSRYFGYPRECGDLYQAISLIGLMQLHDLLLGSLCMRTFSAIPEQILNLREFWRYNVECGIAARTIGQRSRADSHHVFFTLGLLHEIGHAVLFLKAPEASLGALEDSRSQNRNLADIEREYLGFDYGQVGAELMQVWHLPPVYRQVAAFHLQPDDADDEYRPAVEVVHLAHSICQDPGSGSNRDLIDNCIENKRQFRRMPGNIDEIIADEIQTHADSVLSLLWPRGMQVLTPRKETNA